MKINKQMLELKVHELKFALKKLEIHEKINSQAMSEFSSYFKDFIDSVDNRASKHKLRQMAGLAGENEKSMNKTAKRAKQQAQYRKGRNKVSADFQEEVIQPPPEVPKKSLPSEYKSLYRKIANKTHPDKIKGDEDKKAIFQKVTSAIESEDYFKLVEYAVLLDIDIPEEVSLDIGQINVKIEKIQKQITNIIKSVAWEWYHLQEEEQRKRLIEGYATYLLDNK